MKERKKIVIAVDFDGVIIDSLRESFLQSVTAYTAMGGNVIGSSKNEKKFRDAKFLTKGADSYYTIFRLIQQNKDVNFSKMSPAQFQAELRRDAGKVSADFENRFYANRAAMRQEHEAYWLSLHSVSPRIKKWFARLQSDPNNSVWIATGNDFESCKKLLEMNGIKFAPEKIVSKEISKSKAKQIDIIANREGVTTSSVVHFDDSLTYLQETMGIGAKPVLVGWGPGGKRAVKEARRAGIKSIRKPWPFGISRGTKKILRQMRS